MTNKPDLQEFEELCCDSLLLAYFSKFRLVPPLGDNYDEIFNSRQWHDFVLEEYNNRGEDY